MNSTRSESFEIVNEITRQRSGLIKTEDDITFRDLNKNGKLDVYEDSRQSIEARVEDAVYQRLCCQRR